MATPSKINVGLNADWFVEAPDYPAVDGWTIEYSLVNAANQETFSSSNVDGRHKVALSAATTSGFTAGEYFFQAVAKKGSDAYLVETGNLVIEPAFDAARDGRPHCKKVLDAIEALLEGKVVKDVARYIIGSRRLDHYTIPELLQLRDRYKAEWVSWQKAEKIRQGLGGGGNILVRF